MTLRKKSTICILPLASCILPLASCILLLAGLLLLHLALRTPSPVRAQANTLYVSSVSGDDANSCTASEPCRSIQRAVDLAVDGDEIWIATLDNVTPAVYTGTAADIVLLTKGLVLRGGYVYVHPIPGTWVPSFVPATLDGEGVRRPLHVSGAITVSLERLALVRGSATRGGNLYAEGATLHFLGMPVLSGTADYGGGLYLKDCQASFSEGDLLDLLLVQGNSAQYGGGVYVEGGAPLLTALTLQDNTATADGGGFYLEGGSPAVVGAIIQGNQAGGKGGGFYLLDSAARIAATSISSNTASLAGGGLYLDGPLTLDPTALPLLGNNYIRHNQAAEGGGLYFRLSIAGLANTVVADNTASGNGGGMYLYASSALLVHSTIARNAGAEGLYVTHQPGSIIPPVLPIPSWPRLSNTVLVSHSVGLYVESTGLPWPENQVSLQGTLWWGNGADTAGPGEVDIGSTNVYSDPLFTCLGEPPACLLPYHLEEDSPAVDAGLFLNLPIPGLDYFVDIDGQLRPSGAGYDLGVDEVVQPNSVWLLPPLSLRVASAGGVVTHTHLLLNSGLEADSYALTLHSAQGWSTLETSWPITLAAQSSTTVAVRVAVPLTATGDMSETAILTATSQSDPAVHATALERTDVLTVSWSDLAVDKRADAAWVEPGGAIHFTIVMTNAGPLTRSIAVTLSDTWVPTTSVAALDLPAGCWDDLPAGRITCTVDLPAGTLPVTTSLDIILTTTAVYSGPLLNSAQITADVIDLNPLNDRDQALVLVWPADPAIVVTPTQLQLVLNPALTATRSITVANEGLGDLNWSLQELPAVDWLEVAPPDGVLPPDELGRLALTFTAPLSTGVYSTVLRFDSNDPDDLQVDVTVTLVVTSSCIPPTGPGFTYTPITPIEGEVVTFTAWLEQGSLPVTWTWDFGAGITGTGSPLTHTYTAAGDYTVTLRAANRCGEELLSRLLRVGPAQSGWRIYLPLLFCGE